MARLARVVVPGLPHLVTQRGPGRAPIFLESGDQGVYRDLLARETRRRGVEVWAYCLMPDHVHMILVPADADGLSLAVGEAHRRYTGFVNARSGGAGHLFQSRFASVVMDESHLLAAARYVSLNPVRAKLARSARDWPWSSARAHLAGADDGLVKVAPLLERTGDFAAFLSGVRGDRAAGILAFEALRAAETTGRPVGAADFVAALGRRLGRNLAPRKRGRKPKAR
jgi:putative transposase